VYWYAADGKVVSREYVVAGAWLVWCHSCVIAVMGYCAVWAKLWDAELMGRGLVDRLTTEGAAMGALASACWRGHDILVDVY
jgi:hypothetical protein